MRPAGKDFPRRSRPGTAAPAPSGPRPEFFYVLLELENCLQHITPRRGALARAAWLSSLVMPATPSMPSAALLPPGRAKAIGIAASAGRRTTGPRNGGVAPRDATIGGHKHKCRRPRPVPAPLRKPAVVVKAAVVMVEAMAAAALSKTVSALVVAAFARRLARAPVIAVSAKRLVQPSGPPMTLRQQHMESPRRRRPRRSLPPRGEAIVAGYTRTSYLATVQAPNRPGALPRVHARPPKRRLLRHSKRWR